MLDPKAASEGWAENHEKELLTEADPAKCLGHLIGEMDKLKLHIDKLHQLSMKIAHECLSEKELRSLKGGMEWRR